MKRIFRLFPLLLCLPLLFACSPAPDDDGSPFLRGTVTSFDGELAIEVSEGSHGAAGPYWVILGESTRYYGKDGQEIPRPELKSGQSLEVHYNGQVMLSYPPKVAALSVYLK